MSATVDGVEIHRPKWNEITGSDAFHVIYNHSAWHPDTLERLSGRKTHTINKVLYRPGDEQHYTQDIVFGILTSYEYLYVYSALGAIDVGQLRETYAPRLQKVSLGRLPDGNPRLAALIREKARILANLYETKL